MKKVITKDDVAKAISALNSAGKRPTLAAIHAVLGHRGSMSTLVRLKAELDSETLQPSDSPEALEAFRKVWRLGRDEGRKEQEHTQAELRENLRALAEENERLEGIAVADRTRAADLELAKRKAEAELAQLRSATDHDLSQATVTISEAGSRAAKALQELADARGAYAARFAELQAELTSAHESAHNFELQLVRAHALLAARGFASESITSQS